PARWSTHPGPRREPALVAGVGPVQGPVAHDRAQPVSVLVDRGRDGEAADGALATLVIAVEEVDPESPALGDALQDGLCVRIAGVAEGGLPEADVPRGHVQVPALTTKLLGIRVALRQGSQ